VLFQLHIENKVKNYEMSLEGLWFWNIWQIFATRIAHEIPPK
jgi:hypothetical protein